MADFKYKASVFSRAVRQWVGDSPYKAAAFGFVCALIGYGTSIWPF